MLVANLRRNMHFAYMQDDWRATSRLTLNLGLRYEFSTPYWEKDNVLSNFDPATNAMVIAKDGSISDRALVNPDRNNFGPRLGFAYTLTPRTVIRGGYGVSYVHFSRAGGGDLLPINGPQVINAVVNKTVPTAPTFVPAEQGYPAGLADPSQFNPLTANITYMPKDFHSSPVQSWYVSVQRELLHNMLLDVAYVGNRADDLLLFANYNQASANNAAGTILLQDRRPIPSYSDITYPFNGGKSRYKSLQTKLGWRLGQDLTLLSSLTLSKAKTMARNRWRTRTATTRLRRTSGIRRGFRRPTRSALQPRPASLAAVGKDHRWGSNVSALTDALTEAGGLRHQLGVRG